MRALRYSSAERLAPAAASPVVDPAGICVRARNRQQLSPRIGTVVEVHSMNQLK